MANNDRDPRDEPPPHDVVTGEVLSPDEPDRAASLPALGSEEMSLAAGLTKAEIDQQIATAKRYPRSIGNVQKAIETLATLDKETAAEAIYVLPRDGKRITGPSVRFAEIVAQSWGNCRIATRVTNVGKTHLEATGIFHDLETNIAIAKSVSVRITTKNGKRYGDDMITVAAAAGAAKALRNAVLAVVPKAVWRKGLDKAMAVIAGTQETLEKRRFEMVRRMESELGVTPAQTLQLIGVADLADVTLGHMVQLAGVYTALSTGEARLDDLLAETAPEPKPGTKTLGDANGPKPAETPKADTPPADPPKPKDPPKPAAAKKPAQKPAQPKEDPPAATEPETSADPVDEAESGADAPETEQTGPTDAAETTTDDNAGYFGEDQAGDDDNADDGFDPAWSAFLGSLAEAGSWVDMRTALSNLSRSDYFKNATPDVQNTAFRHTWSTMVGLHERTDAPLPDPGKDVGAFRVWLEWEGDAEAIESVWGRLASSSGYSKMPEAARNDLINAKRARKDAIRKEA